MRRALFRSFAIRAPRDNALAVAGRISMVDRMPSPRGDRNMRIELGRARLPWQEFSKLAAGSVVSLESLIDEPVDIVIGGRLVAKGEVLVLDGCFCIRVTQLLGGKEAA